MSNLQQPPAGAPTSNVLDGDSVLNLLQELLPAQHPSQASTTTTTETETSASTDNQQEMTSSAETPASLATATTTTLLKSEYEALAALSHAIMTAVGFRLIGLGEDDSIEADRRNIDDLARANILPARWNTSTESYSFRYTHSHSQLSYVIKCMRMAGKFVIHGTTFETNQICSLDIQVKDFTSPSYFPFTTRTEVDKDPLWNGFISRSRINDFIGQFKVKVVQQLIPGLSKPGYQEDRTASSTTTAGSNTTGGVRADPASTGSSTGGAGGRGRDYYPDDPSAFPGHPGRPGFVPRPPIFGDPFSAEDPDFGGGFHNPYEIGRSDLDPFGGRIGGGLGGIGGPGGFGGIGGIGGGGGGGMIVGPNHPMFRRPPPGGGIGGGGGIYGGPQPLPRGSVPPGARFDPIGPFGATGGHGQGGAPGAGTAHQDPHRGVGGIPGQGRGRGGPTSTFPGEPDNDEAPPPGYMDMFM
ncbi:MAG: PI31 proteasome regulator N-terminal-domain-containing protein [Linnemannia gamsii]|nr:MAG: PI31 proteasome regulator N-terminal-domain-containing protein [Linnemannia gamsii]